MYVGSLEAFSNRANWQATYQLVDYETNEAIDLTGCTVVMALYTQNTRDKRLSATSDDGSITLPDVGVIEWNFTVDQVRRLCAGTYDVGLTISNDDQTVQMIIGTVAVLEGNVP